MATIFNEINIGKDCPDTCLQADYKQGIKMITIEKDSNAEEVFIYGSPEDLRVLAKELWAIAEKGETKGKHREQLTTKTNSNIELSTKLHGEARKYSVIKKLSIISRNT